MQSLELCDMCVPGIFKSCGNDVRRMYGRVSMEKVENEEKHTSFGLAEKAEGIKICGSEMGEENCL